MRSFDYFATFDESLTILGDLFAQGLTLVARPAAFDEPKAPTFDSVSDKLVEILRYAPAFFLAGPFTKFPIQFYRLESGPSAGKYAIDLLTQGPLMQVLIARINTVDGIEKLLPGQISHQNAYKNPKTGEWEKPSVELKAAFSRAVSAIKKRCLRHKIADAEIFIGPAALELLENGKAQIDNSQIVRPSRQ
jgi:hypothetical protein